MREYELVINGKTCDTIMNTTNNHNALLVEAINKRLYNTTRQPMFAQILYTIACRDYEEVENKVFGDLVTMEDFQRTDGDPNSFFDSYGYDVLMNVCDDRDLMTILSFCGIDPNDTDTEDSAYSVGLYYNDYSSVKKTTIVVYATTADCAMDKVEQMFNDKEWERVERIVITELTYQQACELSA